MKKLSRIVLLLILAVLCIALTETAFAEAIPRIVIDGLTNNAFTDENLQSHDFSVIFSGGASVDEGMRAWLTKRTYKVVALWQFKDMDVDVYGSGAGVVWGGKQYIVTAAHTIEFIMTGAPRVYVMDYRGNIIPCTVVKIKQEGDVAVLVAKEGYSILPETCIEEIDLNTKLSESVYSGGYYLNIPVIRGHVVAGDFGIVHSGYRVETFFTIKINGRTAAGFSGGPVVNASRKLIGIVIATAKEREDDSTFFSSSVNIVNLLRSLP